MHDAGASVGDLRQTPGVQAAPTAPKWCTYAPSHPLPVTRASFPSVASDIATPPEQVVWQPVPLPQRGDEDARTLLARKRRRSRRHRSRSEDPASRATRSSRSPPARSAAPTCTCSTAISRRWRAATSSATRTWARSIEVGSEVTNLKIGDRVVVPFTISCGECWFCKKGLFSCCDTHQPQCRDGDQGDGPFARRPVRLQPHAGRL